MIIVEDSVFLSSRENAALGTNTIGSYPIECLNRTLPFLLTAAMSDMTSTEPYYTRSAGLPMNDFEILMQAKRIERLDTLESIAGTIMVHEITMFLHEID